MSHLLYWIYVTFVKCSGIFCNFRTLSNPVVNDYNYPLILGNPQCEGEQRWYSYCVFSGCSGVCLLYLITTGWSGLPDGKSQNNSLTYIKETFYSNSTIFIIHYLYTQSLTVDEQKIFQTFQPLTHWNKPAPTVLK